MKGRKEGTSSQLGSTITKSIDCSNSSHNPHPTMETMPATRQRDNQRRSGEIWGFCIFLRIIIHEILLQVFVHIVFSPCHKILDVLFNNSYLTIMFIERTWCYDVTEGSGLQISTNTAKMIINKTFSTSPAYSKYNQWLHLVCICLIKSYI